MKTTIMILTLVFHFTFLYSQKSESDLQEDLYLNEEQFAYKYLLKLNSVSELRKAFLRSEDNKEKILILKRLTDFINEEMAFITVLDSVERGDKVHNGDNRDWKLRASAIYLLGEKGKKLSEEKRLLILKKVVKQFKKENDPFILSVSAYTLSKLATDDPDQLSNHRLFNKRTISYLLCEKLLILKPYENELCLHLIEASIILNDPYTNLALMEIRKRKFHPVVLSRVKKAIQILKR